MAYRKGWSELTPTYKLRLSNKGITESVYASGTVSLAAARGHSSPRSAGYVHPPRGIRPPKAAVEKLIEGLANTEERRSVERWYERDAPEWLRSMRLSADTAAQIFMANLRPENWESITVYGQRDDSKVIYIESTKGGATRKFVVSDAEGVAELEDWYDSYEFDDPADVEWHDTPNGRK